MITDTSIPAGRGAILRLAEKGVLNSRQTQEALVNAGVIPGKTVWIKFITITLLSLGTAFFLSGVIFFFAYNWDALHKFMKLGSIALVLCAAIAIGLAAGHDTLPGRLSWIAASVMIGVFLAVFGQVYQTGADAWQLFALWALLMAGWAVISLYPPHWTLFLTVAEIAAALAIVQLGDSRRSFITASVAVAGINTLLYMLIELSRDRCKPWRDARWFVRLIATSAIAGYLAPVSSYIFEFGETAEYDIFPGCAIALLAVFLAFVFYMVRKSRDLYILAAALFSLIVYGADFFIRTFDVFKESSVLSFIMLGVFIVALAVGAVLVMKKVAHSWK